MLARRSVALILAGILPAALFAAGRTEDQQLSPGALQDQSSPANDYDVGPKATRTSIPDYPKDAYEKGVEGTVVLEILVDVKGRVARARVKKSIPELDATALACVKKWRFLPAQKDGHPVAALAAATITFKRVGKPEVTVA